MTVAIVAGLLCERIVEVLKKIPVVKRFDWLPIILSMLLGILFCLVLKINVFEYLGVQASGYGAYVLSGLIVGALGGGWHTIIDGVKKAA